MESITYSRARARLSSAMNKACERREPVVIKRVGKPSVVLISLDEFESLEETAHLLRSTENAKRLLSAVIALASRLRRRRTHP